MKAFELFNQQLIKEDLTKVDKDLLKKYNYNMNELKEKFNKYNLNIDNLYLNEKGPFSNFIYLDEYCSTEIYLDKDFLEDERLGLPIILARNENFKNMFLKEEYSLIFHPEFNNMALYYFLKHYKNINKDRLFEIFIVCYQSISFGFKYISEEVLEYIFKYKPTTKEVLDKMIDDDVIHHNTTTDDYLTIYRGQGSKSLDIRKAKSWSLSYEVANRFAVFSNGELLEGKVKVSDIIDYIPGGEEEVLVNYKDIHFK